MTKRSSMSRVGGSAPARQVANDDMLFLATQGGDIHTALPPANDNPSIENLPACLAVTDDEVRLLHRYLGREILALFG